MPQHHFGVLWISMHLANYIVEPTMLPLERIMTDVQFSAYWVIKCLYNQVFFKNIQVSARVVRRRGGREGENGRRESIWVRFYVFSCWAGSQTIKIFDILCLSLAEDVIRLNKFDIFIQRGQKQKTFFEVLIWSDITFWNRCEETASGANQQTKT